MEWRAEETPVSSAAATPARRPLSVRRTTTHDSTRPEGLLGPVATVARGRDLVTGRDGSAAVVGTARVDALVQYSEQTIISISCDPPHAGLETLAGAKAFAGFRRAIDEAMPREGLSRSVRYQLLDDLPTALMLSGRVLRDAGIGIRIAGPRKSPVDICAGWAEGGTLLAGLTEAGPPLNVGPVASPVESVDDPIGWHDVPALPPHSTRRRRRVDVWEEEAEARVECFFRDSHFNADRVETVVHEYTVRARFDPHTLTFLSCGSEPGPLPYLECPAAAASTQRLDGAPVEGLRNWVRSSFVGPTTCTHLNDTLRSLEDVGALLGSLYQ